nr:DUF1471 domain-containing protein [Citrobacter freundii]
SGASSYRITSADQNNFARMTAVLDK